MTSLIKFLNSPKVLWSLLLSGLIIDLILWGRHLGLDTGEWASWVQAFGSIVAIIGAFLIASQQFEEARRAETRRRAADDIRRLQIVSMVFFKIKETADVIQKARKINDPRGYDRTAIGVLDSSQQAVSALPLMELPDATLAVYVSSMPRTIQHAIDAALAIQADTEGTSAEGVARYNELDKSLANISLFAAQAIDRCSREINRLSEPPRLSWRPVSVSQAGIA